MIQNGAQAMPEGGKLEVVAGRGQRKLAVLRIADEGPGIPDEIREKIFDLYFTTKTDGSGIGLAMTYRILQLHHGSIEVQSKTGRGTEFLLRIPLAATEWGRRHLHLPASAKREGDCGMKLPARIVAWLLPLLLTACFHKTHPINIHAVSPPPSHRSQAADRTCRACRLRQSRFATSRSTVRHETCDAARRPSRHVRHKKARQPPTPPSRPRTIRRQRQPRPPAVSAIGQLSSGDPSDLRQQTLDSIAATERGLNGINRDLNDQEQKTAAHIREFLKQAKAALASGDVDGATHPGRQGQGAAERTGNK